MISLARPAGFALASIRTDLRKNPRSEVRVIASSPAIAFAVLDAIAAVWNVQQFHPTGMGVPARDPLHLVLADLDILRQVRDLHFGHGLSPSSRGFDEIPPQGGAKPAPRWGPDGGRDSAEWAYPLLPASVMTPDPSPLVWLRPQNLPPWSSSWAIVPSFRHRSGQYPPDAEPGLVQDEPPRPSGAPSTWNVWVPAGVGPSSDAEVPRYVGTCRCPWPWAKARTSSGPAPRAKPLRRGEAPPGLRLKVPPEESDLPER